MWDLFNSNSFQIGKVQSTDYLRRSSSSSMFESWQNHTAPTKLCIENDVSKRYIETKYRNDVSKRNIEMMYRNDVSERCIEKHV